MGERGTMLQREIIKRRGEKEGARGVFEKYMHIVIYLGLSEDLKKNLQSKSSVNLPFPEMTALPSNNCPWVHSGDSLENCTPSCFHQCESSIDRLGHFTMF